MTWYTCSHLFAPWYFSALQVSLIGPFLDYWVCFHRCCDTLNTGGLYRLLDLFSPLLTYSEYRWFKGTNLLKTSFVHRVEKISFPLEVLLTLYRIWKTSYFFQCTERLDTCNTCLHHSRPNIRPRREAGKLSLDYTWRCFAHTIPLTIPHETRF